MKLEKSCGGIIFQKENGKNLILLVQMNMGHWSFPKGHIEYDESEIETAIREIKEETNIDVSFIPGFRETIVYSPAPDTMKEVVYFLGYPKSQKVIRQVEEIKSVTWLNCVDAMNRLTYDNDKELLKKAFHFINSQ